MGENCIETQRLIQMIRGFNMEQMILRNEIGGYILENVLVKPCILYIYIYICRKVYKFFLQYESSIGS